MVQQQQLNNGLGAEEMIRVLVNRTFKAPRQKGLEGLILYQNEQLLLGYLLIVSMSPELSFASRACVQKALDDLKKDANQKLAGSSTEQKGYLLLTLDRIENRQSAKPFEPKDLPPGSPIGCDF
jgi:hypothetical protein